MAAALATGHGFYISRDLHSCVEALDVDGEGDALTLLLRVSGRLSVRLTLRGERLSVVR